MPLIKESKNYLKTIKIACEESIYLSVNEELRNLFDYLKNYKNIMKISDEEERFTYYENPNSESYDQDEPSTADIEAQISNCPIINEREDYSFLGEWIEESENENRNNYFIMSFVTILCSVFEKNMERVCYKIKQINDLKLTRKNLPGGLVSSYKKFLIQYGGIVSIDEKLWDLLFDIIKIRNIIIHSNLDCIFNGEFREIRLKGKYLPCHGIYHESDIVYLSWHFCEFSIKVINCFFKQLFWYHLKILKRDPLFNSEDIDDFWYIKNAKLPKPGDPIPKIIISKDAMLNLFKPQR
jgi:hypothetical protein